MRLSEWTASAPAGAVTPAIQSALGGILGPLGADADPECWVLWGEEPHVRWSFMVPTDAGLVTGHVRVFVPQEGPRATGKLVRWSRVQVGEFVVETQGPHRVMSATLEGSKSPRERRDGGRGRRLPARDLRRDRRTPSGRRAGDRRRRSGLVTAAPSGATFAAVIFDLDGVIVDSEPWWHAARVDWAAGLGRTWTEADSRACMGLGSRQWSVEMQARLGLDMPLEAVVDAIVGALVDRYHRSPAPRIPGAVEAVRRIAGTLPVAIASGSHAAVIDAALRAVGLADLFGAVVSADDVVLGKPAPDVYLEAARRLGVAPAGCLVVEDALNGTLAGKAAGMTVVLVPNPSFPPGEGTADHADMVVARLADLDPRALVQ